MCVRRGIWALGDRSAILSCTIERNSGNGIETDNECRVHGCTVYGRGAGGSAVCIRVDRSCSVRDNHVTLGPSDTGIEAHSVGSAILDNVISADKSTTGTGIVLDGAAHIVARNEMSTFFGMTSISVTGDAHAIGPVVNVSGAGDISSEYRVTTEGRGRTVDEWKLRADGRDNHWLDCLVGCAVAASMEGAVLPGTQGERAAKRRRFEVPKPHERKRLKPKRRM